MKHYSITPMTDAEEEVWMLIVNDIHLNDEIYNHTALAQQTAVAFMAPIVNKIHKHRSQHLIREAVKYDLVYLHVLDNQDNIDYAHTSLIDKYVDCGSEGYAFDTHGFNVGDEVRHKDHTNTKIVALIKESGIECRDHCTWYYENISLVKSRKKPMKLSQIEPKIGDLVTHTSNSYGKLVGTITGEDNNYANEERWTMSYPTGKSGSWIKKYVVLYDPSKDATINAIINFEAITCQQLTTTYAVRTGIR